MDNLKDLSGAISTNNSLKKSFNKSGVRLHDKSMSSNRIREMVSKVHPDPTLDMQVINEDSNIQSHRRTKTQRAAAILPGGFS